MRVATFNLYQFLTPGGHWYEKRPDGKNTYSVGQWTKKTAWIQDTLAVMQADIVGFQEVFSLDALETLTKSAGFDHFASVAQPGQDADDPDVYFNPPVALASKHPILNAEPLKMDADLVDFLPVQPDFDFSRTPILATIDTPEFGPVKVVVAHLKSKRPKMEELTYDDSVPWRDRVLDTMRRLSRGHIASLLQRGAEAAGVYLHSTQLLEADETTPIIILGDLNDDLDAVSIQALTMGGRIYEVGGVDQADWPPGTAGQMYRYRFADAYNLLPNQLTGPRPGTHLYKKEWSTLDYVMLSDVFSIKSPNCIGQVIDMDILNDHIEADGVGNKTQSDHAPVVVELRPV